MSEGGKGKPVDDLDSICQQYKQCQKCARMTHGEVYYPKMKFRFRIYSGVYRRIREIQLGKINKWRSKVHK